MMKELLLGLFLMTGQFILAQIDQEVIDKVDTYPSSFSLYETLSERIITDFENDYDRAAAIYTWMAMHIKYDAKALFSGQVQRVAHFSYRNEAEKYQKEKALRDELARSTLKKKKAVCQGYAELYRLLCQACGIECEVISGYSRSHLNDIGKVRSEPDHAWNAIRIDDEWSFVDATWGAGHVDYKTRKFVPAFTTAFYAVEPAIFTYNHFPEEQEWNFTELTLKDFSQQPLFYHTFFKKDIELLSPMNGVLKKTSKQRIIIKFKTTRDRKHVFHYAFHGMKYMKDADVQRNGDVITLLIDAEGHRSGYLDIIIDDETVMTYKLRL
ncbi:transglutaminase domain-containing protein [Carboxylicivirga sp. RSCT41]|uniref:transglutaminase domain-containing protein n=1 Tax=Carboxylicivirga agarovorans TaxID=3417570 RepID=UPI003D33E662